MRWSIVLLAVVIALPSSFADDKPEWKEFTSKEGKFTVDMPGKVKQRDQDTESDFGKGILHMNVAEVGKVMYGANYSDYPAEVKKVKLKDLYDASREGAVANLKGKLVSEKDIKLGEHPGREIRIEVADGKFLFRVRVYQIEQRQYQVVVFGSKDDATSKDADKFLDSFKLTEK